MFSYEEIQKYNETDIRIYKYIVSNTDKIQYMTIRELAKELHVSASTILRFCSKNNFDGYSEFKDALKKEMTLQSSRPPMEDLQETACYLLCNKFFCTIKYGGDIMTELEKCMAGEDYNCHDEIFLEFKRHARKLLQEYNALAYEQKEKKEKILKELLGNIGTEVSVASPFLCDYGRNIFLGNNVSVNMNCTFVDCNEIRIGDHVLIASNVQLYTAAHPVGFDERYTKDAQTGRLVRHTYALPIKIGNGCWLGGGVIVLPGVTIGDGSVIGAGSVVTKDVPENSLAAGNPCRVIRKINGENT